MRPLYDLASVFADQIRTAEAEASRVYEPVIAIVTENKDPSKLGRVRIKVPVLSTEDKTWWAPIIMLGAGKNRGWFFIPEVDDEVLVMFEHGDMDRPVIVGALWNGTDTPPDKNPGGNPRRMIKSRQGSQIIFDDDKEQLILQDGTSKGRITIDAKANKITIEALADDVCFQAPNGELQIVAKSASFTASEGVQVVANKAMAWDGATAKISGKTTAVSGSNANANCGNAQGVGAPSASPADVPHPYKS